MNEFLPLVSLLALLSTVTLASSEVPLTIAPLLNEQSSVGTAPAPLDEAYYLDSRGTTRRHSQDEMLAKMKLQFTWDQHQCWETDLETNGKKVRNLTRNSNCEPSKTVPLFDPRTGRCQKVDAETKGAKYADETALKTCKTMETEIVWKTVGLYSNCYEVDRETRGAKFSDATLPHIACAPDEVICSRVADDWHLQDAATLGKGYDSKSAGRQVCGTNGLDPNKLANVQQQATGQRDSRAHDSNEKPDGISRPDSYANALQQLESESARAH